MVLTTPPFFGKQGRLAALEFSSLGIASAIFLIASPFLAWVTIVSVVVYQGFGIFGTATQSDLLGVSAGRVGTDIPAAASVIALVLIIALVAGGLLMLRNPKAGLAVSGIPTLVLVTVISPIFGGNTSGLESTYVSPGIGLFTTFAGLALGAVSFRSASRPLSLHLDSLRTMKGLSTLGSFVSSVSLSLDVTNHLALGQLPEFIGDGPTEQFLHLGLVAGVAATAALVLLRHHLSSDFYLLSASLATLGVLGLDAALSLYVGTLHEFLGHNTIETALHLPVYYGVALMMVARLIGKPESPTTSN